MKTLTLFGCAILLAAGVCPSQSVLPYHDDAYLCGGYPGKYVGPFPNTTSAPGIWVVRGDGSATTVALPGYISYGFCMDVDNRHVVVACQGLTSTLCPPEFGIYRFDPHTMQYTTILGPDTLMYQYIYNLHVNPDGDYVFNTCAQTQTGPNPRSDYLVMKVGFNRTVTTLLTTAALGRQAFLNGAISTNIDTGNILVSDLTYTSSPMARYPILEIAPDGTVKSWSTGGNAGWLGYWQLPQNHRTGDVEGPYQSHVYQVKPGTTSRTTLATIHIGPTPVTAQRNYDFDLQTAPQLRFVGTPYTFQGGYKTWIGRIDRNTGALTSIHVTGIGARNAFWYDFDFYRGRHIQTWKTAEHRWAISLSCPRCAGDAYRLGASLSGVRPGIPLPDGRRLNLNSDAVLLATVQNHLPHIWNPGPGVLDVGGEARGVLDLTPLNLPRGGLGIPLWIAMVVVDPKAPGGVKYIPDTWVLRI